MEYFRRAIAAWQERRAAHTEAEIRAWHEASVVVLDACSRALRDPGLPRSDIGVILDRIDRSLFRLRDTRFGARRVLRRRDAALGARVGSISEAIVDLRNDTARFLIRAQGPTPLFLQQDEARSNQSDAYRQALQDVGRPALARASEIERDLRQLWLDLEIFLAQLTRSPERR